MTHSPEPQVSWAARIDNREISQALGIALKENWIKRLNMLPDLYCRSRRSYEEPRVYQLTIAVVID